MRRLVKNWDWLIQHRMAALAIGMGSLSVTGLSLVTYSQLYSQEPATTSEPVSQDAKANRATAPSESGPAIYSDSTTPGVYATQPGPAEFKNELRGQFEFAAQSLPQTTVQVVRPLQSGNDYGQMASGVAVQGFPMGGMGGPARVGHEYHFSIPFDAEDHKLTERSFELSRTLHRMNLSNEEREKMQKNLRDVLDEQFDARQDRRQTELKELKDRVEKLEKSIQDRTAKKKEIVEQRFNELTGASTWEDHGPDVRQGYPVNPNVGIQNFPVNSFQPNRFKAVPPAEAPRFIPNDSLPGLPAQAAAMAPAVLPNIAPESRDARIKRLEKELEKLKRE